MAKYEVRALPLYTKEHSWAKKTGNTVVIGITDYAQKMLKEINYADLPEEGDSVEQMQPFAELESTKAVSPVYCPFGGTVTAVNEDAMDEPGLINSDPYDSGWLIEIDPADFEAEKENLLTAQQYEEYLDTL